jgi:hypothetical protein
MLINRNGEGDIEHALDTAREVRLVMIQRRAAAGQRPVS